jgi:hypothetical protein
MSALHVVRELELHVVAKVVEAELVVGPVGDVGGVGALALGVVQVMLDDADGHAEEAVDRAHPLRVAAGQVVVDRHDVHALAFERVQIGGQCRHERLAFARLHLGDLALVQHRAADQLDVEVPHFQHPPAGFPDHGEGFGQQVVDGRPLRQPLAEFRGSALELLVGQTAQGGLERVDLLDEGTQAL